MKARFAVGFISLLLVAGSAAAMPSVGDARPTFALKDAWERSLTVDQKANKPMLIVYEDKDSATQNQALKDELAKLAKGGKYKDAIALLPIADLSGYDYWPVRGFVKDSVQSESVKIDATIYCDWNGSARKAMGLTAGKSNIVLYGRDGKVLFAAQGALSKESRDKLIELLRAQVKP